MDADLPVVFDGHNDTLLDVYLPERGDGRTFLERSESGHLDLPRAREGGFGGGLFAVFTPNDAPRGEPEETEDGYAVPYASAVDPERARAHTYDVLAELHRIETESGGDLRVVRTTDDLRDCLADGTVAAVAHVEGAAAIEPDLSNLDFLYAAGVRSLGLTWSRPNAFGHGVPYRFPHSPDTGPGLTDAGRDLVRACNDRGILVDLAHLNEQGFWDVAEVTDAPLVVGHAGAHEVSPSTRNLTDEQLDAIADSDGLVGVWFSVDNTRPDGDRVEDTPISVFVDHVEYIADRIGVEHVAMGSDFDGCLIPAELGDVTGMPKVLAAIRKRGFDDGALRQFAHENWLRVLDETWAN